MKKYDLVVLIGRFQPFHNAHAYLIKKAKEIAPEVLVIVGSANSPRTVKNPFTDEEREEMIRRWSWNNYHDDIHIRFVADTKYDDTRWIEKIAKHIKEVGGSKRVALIGHDKDKSTYYLNYFPQIDFISIPKYPEVGETIDATKIRELWFRNELAFVQGVVPQETMDMIEHLTTGRKKFIHGLLQKEFNYITSYKKAWESAPYPPTLVTVDAIVVQSGHVLLIRRGVYPGKGLFALPGGYIEQDETLLQSLVRELREETRIKVPEKVLLGSIKHNRVFDAPNRSLRGRTITHAYLIHLDDTQKLPRIAGGDDADEAKWISIGDLAEYQELMFEDHYDIIEAMLNQL